MKHTHEPPQFPRSRTDHRFPGPGGGRRPGPIRRRTLLRTATAPAIDYDTLVVLAGDALPRNPAAEAARLQALLDRHAKPADSYLAGGAVAELEAKFSSLLGKEDTVFMPTGTLANHIALRLLCGEAKHALVQQESHVYRDESNTVTTLSGINLVPLAPGRAAPTLDEVAGRDRARRSRPVSDQGRRDRAGKPGAARPGRDPAAGPGGRDRPPRARKRLPCTWTARACCSCAARRASISRAIAATSTRSTSRSTNTWARPSAPCCPARKR
jgi:hypothetical protein